MHRTFLYKYLGTGPEDSTFQIKQALLNQVCKIRRWDAPKNAMGRLPDSFSASEYYRLQGVHQVIMTVCARIHHDAGQLRGGTS